MVQDITKMRNAREWMSEKNGQTKLSADRAARNNSGYREEGDAGVEVPRKRARRLRTVLPVRIGAPCLSPSAPLPANAGEAPVVAAVRAVRARAAAMLGVGAGQKAAEAR